MARWIVVGCGYTGARLVRRQLALGCQVIATRRTSQPLLELAAACGGSQLTTIPCDVTELGQHDIDWSGAVVVYSAPPHGDGAQIEASAAQLIAEGAAKRLVYVSSTGVYPNLAGDWIDEDNTLEPPASEHGKKRLAAEQAILEGAKKAGLSSVSLRAAGIYGPGRGVHARMRAGTYKIVGPGDTYVNRVHVDDLVEAIVLAGDAVDLPRNVYNVADGHPTKTREQALAIANMLGLPTPKSIPLEEASTMARAFLLGNRRISPRALEEELGWKPRYPSYAEGVAQALKEEDG